jgi:actin, other eukaryote
LPDGTDIALTHELYQCTEKFFQPRLFDQLLSCEADEPLPKAVYKSIMSCGMDLRKNLLSHIVLAGGNTMFKGFEKRFSMEMKSLLNVGMSKLLQVKASADRHQSVWVGGTVLASMSTFEGQWITARDYDEIGINIVQQKCPMF